jgi:hypothetical protein
MPKSLDAGRVQTHVFSRAASRTFRLTASLLLDVMDFRDVQFGSNDFNALDEVDALDAEGLVHRVQ